MCPQLQLIIPSEQGVRGEADKLHWFIPIADHATHTRIITWPILKRWSKVK